MYSDVVRAITKYYQENGEVPSLATLALKFSRSAKIQTAVTALTQVNAEDIDLDLAIEALRDEYAQHEVLKMLQEDLLENISMFSSEEILDAVAAIPLAIERKLQHKGKVLDQSQITVFQDQTELNQTFINTGISNKWDNDFRGVARQELILLGGRRGSGKSVVCTNLAAKQYREGKIAPYYTIEMTGRETLLRILSVLAEVPALEVKNGTISGENLYKLAKTRAEMFDGGLVTYEAFIAESPDLTFGDFNKLDKELCKNHTISHPLIIVDDPHLTLSTIDVSLSKLKAKWGDLLTMGIVDYLNEVKLDSKADPYDWVYQKEVATGLKSLCRKHDIAMFSPYQMDESGEARFSKSILDPADMAFVITVDKKEGTMKFTSTKLRSLPDSVFKLKMDWNTLRLNPADIPFDIEAEAEAEAEAKKPKRSRKPKADPQETKDPNPKYDDLGAGNFELN